jgi:hypothetical protein
MQKQLLDRSNKAAGAALSVCKLSPFLQLTQLKGTHRIRIALPAAPRHQLCSLNRSLRKQLRTADLAFWQATGGDFLKTSVANGFSRLAQDGSN